MNTERVLVGLGGNLGDRTQNLQWAIDLLVSHPAIRLVKASRFYETAPVDIQASQPGELPPPFLNAVLAVDTELSPAEFLEYALAIEQRLGRVRIPGLSGYFSRTVDIDLLFYGARCERSATLEIPHPRLQDRAFVLRPLLDVAPDWRHPLLHRTMTELYAALSLPVEATSAHEPLQALSR